MNALGTMNPNMRVRRQINLHRAEGSDLSQLLTREWLVTNGLGGYASGTISGVATRRYHGTLIAALAGPLGRVNLLSHVTERLRLPDGTSIDLWGEERRTDQLNLYGADYLIDFTNIDGMPKWRYQCGDHVLEKCIVMPHGQNTVYIHYKLTGNGGPVRLKLMPLSQFRGHDASVSSALPEPIRVVVQNDRYELTPSNGWPALKLQIRGHQTAFTFERREVREVIYRVEKSRGYDHEGPLWSPGYFRATLSPGQDVTLIASADDWDKIEALTPDEVFEAEKERRHRLLAVAPPGAQSGVPAELVLAADQFLIEPVGRVADAAWAHASGDEVRSVIAGLSLVYRLGPGHDDQPGGTDALHRAVRRCRLHPADICPLCEGRVDPEHVPGRREERAVSHGRCHPLVLPRPAPLSRGDRR